MGQYYSALVIDENNNIKTLKPWPFDNGAKLMEHSWIGGSFMNAVYSMIHGNPCKVAWIGDYSDAPYEPKDDAYAKAMPLDEFLKFYEMAWDESEESSLEPTDFSEKQLSLVNHATSGTYLINHSRKCYLELGAYIQRAIMKINLVNSWAIDPLSLLTACGNGRGGGDFSKSNIGYENIGIWAFDKLEYSDKMPQGYTEEVFLFKENRN